MAATKPTGGHSRRSFFAVTFRTFYREMPAILVEGGEGRAAQQCYVTLTVVFYSEYEQMPELIQTSGIEK
jgi:hypothetical protein